jgi:hypothetical protein
LAWYCSGSLVVITVPDEVDVVLVLVLKFALALTNVELFETAVFAAGP